MSKHYKIVKCLEGHFKCTRCAAVAWEDSDAMTERSYVNTALHGVIPFF